MKKKKQNLEVDANGNLRKKGFLSGIYNFGYYYKSYIIVFSVILVFIVLLYFSLQSAQADMYLYLATSQDSVLTEEQVNALFENANGYVEDFDGDGTPYFVPKWLKLSQDVTDPAYGDLGRALDDQNVVCFVVDETVYSYLRERDALRDLAFFGLEGVDDYRILLNGTGYMSGIDTEQPLFLVMKYFPDEKYEDYFISLLTSSVVDICKELTAG